MQLKIYALLPFCKTQSTNLRTTPREDIVDYHGLITKQTADKIANLILHTFCSLSSYGFTVL